jgi:hypothetical protein
MKTRTTHIKCGGEYSFSPSSCSTSQNRNLVKRFGGFTKLFGLVEKRKYLPLPGISSLPYYHVHKPVMDIRRV